MTAGSTAGLVGSGPRERCRGVPALTGRLEPWALELCRDASRLAALVDRHGSPVNLIDPSPMARNAAELAQRREGRGGRAGHLLRPQGEQGARVRRRGAPPRSRRRCRRRARAPPDPRPADARRADRRDRGSQAPRAARVMRLPRSDRRARQRGRAARPGRGRRGERPERTGRAAPGCGVARPGDAVRPAGRRAPATCRSTLAVRRGQRPADRRRPLSPRRLRAGRAGGRTG